MTATSAIVCADWIETAKSLAGAIASYRDESESLRQMAPALFEAIRETGVFDMMVPKALGGPQTDFETHLRLLEEISRQDGSTGWNVMIWSAQGMFADYFSPEAAREILSKGSGNLIAGALNPTGMGVEVEGGFRVSGRWSFASGCQYATWLIAGFVMMDGEHPRFGAEGMPELRLGLIPAGDCEILDTWHTAGLRGTGSHDFQVRDALIPERRTVMLPQFFIGPEPRPGTAYRTPFADLGGTTLAAVGLGIARDAIDSFKAMAAGKTPAIGITPLGSLHTVHEKVGRAEALLRSARAYLFETVRGVTSAHQAGAPVEDDDRAAMRLAATYAAHCAVETVDIVFDAAGGSSVYALSRLERCFRNAHMITHHMLVSPMNIEMVGQYLLGGGLHIRR
jgi:alkylation response protein AidB-like acyl-CoA dehydrogenase